MPILGVLVPVTDPRPTAGPPTRTGPVTHPPHGRVLHSDHG